MIKVTTLAAVLLFSAVSSASAAPAVTLSNQNFSVALTGDNIIAVDRQTGHTVFSATDFEHAEYLLLREQAGLSATETTPFWVGHKLTVISLFGPFLGMRDDTDIEQGSGAISGGGSRYWTIDLRLGETFHFDPSTPLAALPDGGAITSLATLYPPGQISARLVADPFIRKLVSASAGDSPEAILNNASGATADACFDVPSDILTSFAIISIKYGTAASGQAAIRLALPGQPSCQAKLTILGLTFPLSAVLQTATAGARVVTPSPGVPPGIIAEGQHPPTGGSQFAPAN